MGVEKLNDLCDYILRNFDLTDEYNDAVADLEESSLREDWTEIRPREHKTDTGYTYNFWVSKTGGLSFECDKDGNVYVDELNPTARKNYEYAMSHPEDYIAQGVEEYSYNYVEPALVKSSKCGAEFIADPNGWGEVECPECGQLYNGFGQELARRGTDVDWWDAGEEIYPDDDYYYESIRLKESWANPCRWFDKFTDILGDPSIVDDTGWDEATQEERNAMVQPAVDKFIEMYADEMIGPDWQMFLDDLTDANYHTERRLFANYFNK